MAEPRSLTPTEIVAELCTHRGGQWDPTVVDLLLGLLDSGELELTTNGPRLLERPAQPTVREAA